MSTTAIGGMNKDLGFATAPMRGGGFDSSFLGSQKPNYSINMGEDTSNLDEHTVKVQRLLEKARRMVNANNTT